jgi:hypothetical protein
MSKALLVAIAASLMSGCWFSAGRGGVGGGVGKTSAPAPMVVNRN